MPKTVQIRDIDDATYSSLAMRAASVQMSVPEFLKREASRIASRPTPEEWLERTRRRSVDLGQSGVVETLDESRGAFPKS